MKRDFASLSPQEALHVAIFIEERNAGIYENFSAMFAEFCDADSQAIAAAFQEMAVEERRHGSLLQQRYAERFGNRACALTDADITDLIEVPQLDDGELFIIGRIRSQKALEVALAAEQQAHSYYSRLSGQTEEPQLRALYTEFVQMERDHEEFIEQKLKQARLAAEGG